MRRRVRAVVIVIVAILSIGFPGCAPVEVAKKTKATKAKKTKGYAHEGGGGLYHFTDPVWNVWAERSSTPSFNPQNLQPGQDYWLLVNLAALQYRQFEGEGVYSQDTSASFVDWMKRNSDINSADLS